MENKVIITVVGKDTVGIIARICTYLAENGVNVLDITYFYLLSKAVLIMRNLSPPAEAAASTQIMAAGGSFVPKS